MYELADKRQVFLCDVCHRRVAEVTEDGKLVVYTRHDHEFHETKINFQNAENGDLTKVKK